MLFLFDIIISHIYAHIWFIDFQFNFCFLFSLVSFFGIYFHSLNFCDFFSLQDPTPFAYSFNAARSPGAKPDRYVESEGDADGVVRGSYAYLDPNFNWHKVFKKT